MLGLDRAGERWQAHEHQMRMFGLVPEKDAWELRTQPGQAISFHSELVLGIYPVKVTEPHRIDSLVFLRIEPDREVPCSLAVLEKKKKITAHTYTHKHIHGALLSANSCDGRRVSTRTKISNTTVSVYYSYS